MNDEGLWRSFFDTGDPLCYLLAKRFEEQARRERADRPERKKTGDGDMPRPSD